MSEFQSSDTTFVWLPLSLVLVTMICFPFSGPFGLGELIAKAVERLGARPLKRFIQKHVETIAARAILEGRIGDGDTILIDLLRDADGEELTAERKKE